LKMKSNEMGRDEISTISGGVIIEGKLTSNGNVRIDGRVNGDVNANGNVIVGENGEINGEVNADIINLGGKVTGTVNAREKLVLEAKSILKGDLVTKILVIEAGAYFEGKSSMNAGSGAKEQERLTLNE
jgi:cytoskeletal protein CcmA (bactofilin family)